MHQGKTNVQELLVSLGADVEACDEDGDRCSLLLLLLLLY